MRKTGILLVFIFLVLTGIKSQIHDQEERDWRDNQQVIKIISYNIFNGFNWGKDTSRQDKFVEWVKQQSPDIIALQELCGFSETKLLDLAYSYGHSYAAIVKEDGYPVGITSRFPIEIIEKRIKGYGHGMLHCRILDLDFLVTHLNPSDWKTRKEEANHMVEYIQSKKLTRCLLMGDLNAHSPFDAHILESRWQLLKAMLESDLKTTNGKVNLNDGYPEYSVISTFISASLHDMCKSFVPDEERYTYPTRILVSTPKGEMKIQQQERLDYIFVSDDLRSACPDAYIYNGADTDYLSDHYPIGIRLLLTE